MPVALTVKLALWPAPTVRPVGWLVMFGASCGDQPENQIMGFVAASRRGSLFVTPIVCTPGNEMGLPTRSVLLYCQNTYEFERATGPTYTLVSNRLRAHESNPPAVPLEPARVTLATPGSPSKVQPTNEKP